MAVLEGRMPDTLPVIPQSFMYAVETAGYKIGEVNRDGRKMAQAHIVSQEKYGYDGCVIDFDDATIAEAVGAKPDTNQVFTTLYEKALEGDADCGGLLSYGYLSGEFITGLSEGRPLFVRKPDSTFTLANFMRAHLFSALGALKIGMDILEKEEVQVDEVLGHGGFFKTKGVGQRLLAAAMGTDISVMETAGEGGAWGIALLASYLVNKKESETLEAYLSERVFAGMDKVSMSPDPKDQEGFKAFMESYRAGLPIEKAAVEHFA